MQKWTRWQSWVALVAGAYAALSPIWTATEATATWTMVVLGVVTAVIALWALAMPQDRISEYALVLMGVLMFISPWVMGFAGFGSLATTAWVVGVITFVVGILAVPQVEERMHLNNHHRPVPH